MNPLFQNVCSFIDLVCVVNKGQAAWFGLAWLPVVCENVFLFSVIPVIIINYYNTMCL